jgi:hypothetical protein
MNKLEKSWIMYDVENSAFTLVFNDHNTDIFKNLASAETASAAPCLRLTGDMPPAYRP